jgi:hypothetical protein
VLTAEIDCDETSHLAQCYRLALVNQLSSELSRRLGTKAPVSKCDPSVLSTALDCLIFHILESGDHSRIPIHAHMHVSPTFTFTSPHAHTHYLPLSHSGIPHTLTCTYTLHSLSCISHSLTFTYPSLSHSRILHMLTFTYPILSH